MSSVSNGLYFLALQLVSVMCVIYRKIRHAHYLYIKRNVEKVWGARYLSKNTVIKLRIISILQYVKCVTFSSYLNWCPAGNSTFQLGAHNKGNCLTFIIRLRIISILHIILSLIIIPILKQLSVWRI